MLIIKVLYKNSLQFMSRIAQSLQVRMTEDVDFLWGNEFFFLPACPDRLWGPPNEYRGIFFRQIKRPGREADHSPPPTAELKNTWSYTASPPIRPHGVAFN